MLKVLVTGGSGFIGTNLIDNLLRDKYQVLNLDIEPPANSHHLPQWKKVNILKYSEFEKAALKFSPDYIIHLAAVTDLDGKTIDYYHTNIQGTQNVIDISDKLSDLKKVIFTSSMYVCKPGSIPPDYNTYTPHTLYGRSKVEGELLVKAIKNPSYKWIIIRPTSIWGPWFKVPYIDFFNMVYQGKYFNFGKTCTKTYGYVGNTVFQIRLLMAADDIYNKTFYIGDKQPTPIADWANEISIDFGRGPVKRIPFRAIKIAALIGDMLSKAGVKFPLTSFRLNNMMTDNVFPLTDLYEVTGDGPYTRAQGTSETVKWLIEHKNYRLKSSKQLSA
ncbi:NAD-dependent epimerase/dehydratase family protein [Mucilaginibacter litoreus]|uniref:NAD-dependent epimerase/dehydratase family protein n=1 Tax=Mucilaginibacter litoreus TaxID=1048221 RepID=A0ABW3ALV0_9SPHI